MSDDLKIFISELTLLLKMQAMDSEKGLNAIQDDYWQGRKFASEQMEHDIYKLIEKFI